MAFYLSNTATRCQEEFIPLATGKVRMYVCGPTVYDYFHVGNARAFVVFDVLRRVLEHQGYQVTFVQNITDVDDKIIQRAAQEGRDAAKLAEEYTAAFFQDLQDLGCRKADYTPKATEHIPDIIQLIERIMRAGFAYVVEGNVYFRVRTFEPYGRLSGKHIDELEQGARVEVDARKQDPLDFALWKAAKPGEPAWDSPWGRGRPGWHIECSAMSMKYLGEQFDIHGGGEDLVFPHHENENAQSESVTGKPLARYWIHNGYLKIAGEKMSKSLGNFWLAREVLKQYPTQVIRLFLLSAHYRSPLDFSQENILAVQNGYIEFEKTLERLERIIQMEVFAAAGEDEAAEALQNDIQSLGAEFQLALANDLNTPAAIGQIYTLANRVKQLIAGKKIIFNATRKNALAQAKQKLLAMTGVLGIEPLLYQRPLTAQDLEDLSKRAEARAKKDYQISDKYRQHLHERHWDIEDTAIGAVASTAISADNTFMDIIRQLALKPTTAASSSQEKD